MNFMWMSLWILSGFLLALLTFESPRKNAGSRMPAGEGTHLENFPELAKQTIRFVDADGSTFCSGSILPSGHILSAAHCFADRQDFENLKAYIGTDHSLKTPMNLSKVIIHKDYANSQPHDLALVKLDSSPLVKGKNAFVSPTTILEKGDALLTPGFGLLPTTDGFLQRDENSQFFGRLVAAKYETSSDLLHVAKQTSGARICSGDSGAGTYVLDTGVPRLVGVAVALYTKSQGVEIGTEEFQQFKQKHHQDVNAMRTEITRLQCLQSAYAHHLDIRPYYSWIANPEDMRNKKILYDSTSSSIIKNSQPNNPKRPSAKN